MKKILVTGGCGYIGSHTLVDLIENGFEVVSIDNLSRSSADVLKGIARITGVQVRNYVVDLRDLDAVQKVFKKEKHIDGIIHFAAYKTVPESVAQPLLYFDNNLNTFINVLRCADIYEVKHMVFSSSCSVYGNVDKLPVTEQTPLAKAESPYARTKQIGEQILEDVCKATTMRAVSLRYFNPAGAHDSIEIGETPVGVPANIVPRITGTARGDFETFTVFGHTLDTRDGTCIRDYIHIMDIARAHTKSLVYLLSGKSVNSYEVYNLGTGNGVSVLEMIQSFERVSGVKLNYVLSEPRPGDVVAIYADNTRVKKTFQWAPQKKVDDMMRSAWLWNQKLNK